MNFQTPEFKGDWSFQLRLPSLASFQERNGAYTSRSSDIPNSGLYTIEFEDDLSENSDPYPEQFNTLNYIIENQELISRAIIECTLQRLPEILLNYGLEQEPEYRNLNSEKIKSLIGFSSITIKIISKDSFSYFDLSGGCNWDEEHGLNLLFHKSNVISFSDIDGGSAHEAEKDGGSNKHSEFGYPLIGKPVRYSPHPKYNTLKPSQKWSNETYEHSLIVKGYNEDFIAGVEKGEISINGKWQSQDQSYLEIACGSQNNRLVAYLLSKNAEIRYALRQCVSYRNNPEGMELLLRHGADINAQYANGATVIFEIVQDIQNIYSSFDHYRGINRPDLITEENLNRLSKLKDKVKKLIDLGADPYIKNVYGFSCFDLMRNAKETSRAEVNEYLLKCLDEKKT